MKITNHKILITGGATGIGLALANRFIKKGNTVISVDRNPAHQEKAQKLLPSLITFRCDLLEATERNSLIGWLAKAHPDLNILVNNAAVQFNYSLNGQENQEERLNEEIEINLKVPMMLTNAKAKCTRLLRHQGWIEHFLPGIELPIGR